MDMIAGIIIGILVTYSAFATCGMFLFYKERDKYKEKLEKLEKLHQHKLP